MIFQYKKIFPILFLLAVVILFQGCSMGPKVSSTFRTVTELPKGKLAIAPTSGVLGDAIGVELFQRGYDVMSATQINALYRRLHFDIWQGLTRANLSELHKSGIGMLLIVRAGTSYGILPQSAVVQVLDARDGETLAAVNWDSGDDWSISNPGIVAAAKQIANELDRGLRGMPRIEARP
jgi:hypothetical protein